MKHSFKARLIISFTVFFVVGILGMFMIVLSFFHSSLMNSNERIVLDGFATANRQILTVLDNAWSEAVHLRNEKEIEDYLLKTEYATANDEILARYNMVQTMAKSIRKGNAVDGLIYLLEDGRAAGITRTASVFLKSEHPLYSILCAKGPKMSGISWIGTYSLQDIVLYNPARAAEQFCIVGVSRFPYSFHDKRENAIITQMILVDEPRIRDCFAYLGGDEQISLIDGMGCRLSDTNTKAAFGERCWYSDLIGTEQPVGSFCAKKDGMDWQIIYYHMPETNWTLVKQIPLEVYRQPVATLQRTVGCILISLVIICVLLYILWIHRFLKPLYEITQGLEIVRDGDMSVRLHRRYSTAELELMRQEFNAMIDSINGLIDESKEMEKRRLKLEMHNLQARLNPHMVFNTITAIRWIAILHEENTISDMLVELTELIQPVFKQWRLSWSLKEELNYLKHYINLMNLRFGGQPTVQMQIPDQLLDVAVPCYFLQPLLENSCEHARINDRNLNIRIRGWNEEEDLYLLVEDDGRGIEADKLAQLNQRMMEDDFPQDMEGIGHSGIGLISIHRRLILQYGKSCGLTITNLEKGGTSILLHLKCIPYHDSQAAPDQA